MKIGILTPSNDMFSLFNFLHKQDHEYIVWCDDASGFWGDLSADIVLDRVALGMEYLLSQAVDLVIVPPIVELLLNSGTVDYKSPIQVFPLFSQYVVDQVLPFSLIGKIGFVGDYLDLALGQDLLKKLTSKYVLTPNQTEIKKFHFPFVWRGREARLWKILLENLSWSNPLTNTLIKNDLKYFKDAAVDTLIPMNYSYFWAEKTISHLLNFKKTRFHGIDTLEAVFEKLVGDQKSEYSVSVLCTGHGKFLTRNKKLLWLLDKGKSGKLVIETA